MKAAPPATADVRRAHHALFVPRNKCHQAPQFPSESPLAGHVCSTPPDTERLSTIRVNALATLWRGLAARS